MFLSIANLRRCCCCSVLQASRALAWSCQRCSSVCSYVHFYFELAPLLLLLAAGIARTGVELSALLKCLQALCGRNRRAVVNSLLCCYLLPFIMTLQVGLRMMNVGILLHILLYICIIM
jgi:hypothetical protein